MTAPAKSPRPRRQGRADRLLKHVTSIDEIRCDMATAPFDHACNEMDRKWGIDRLPELVSIETADKWGSAMAKLNAAIAACDSEETKARVGVCVRGLAAMNAEAEAAGHKPTNPEVWEAEYNGRVFSVIQDVKDWIRADVPQGRRIYTMHEVAIALDALDKGVFAGIKDVIPEARISEIRKLNPIPEDESIPF